MMKFLVVLAVSMTFLSSCAHKGKCDCKDGKCQHSQQKDSECKDCKK